MRDQEDHVAAGWHLKHSFRWIEAGNLRLDEDEHGARAVTLLARTGPQQVAGPTWISATELAGLVRHLAGWFTDDPAEAIRQIETSATYVKNELEACNDRARIDEEHPPYDKLTRVLDVLLTECKRLREVGLLADRPKKTLPRPADLAPNLLTDPSPTSSDLSTDMSLLCDKRAPAHPAYEAFRRQMRGRSYGMGPLNQAWAFFREGWEGNGEEGDKP